MSTDAKKETESAAAPDRFQELLETLDESGVPATIELLARTLESEKKFPQLFEALLMKKRHPLLQIWVNQPWPVLQYGAFHGNWAVILNW